MRADTKIAALFHTFRCFGNSVALHCNSFGFYENNTKISRRIGVLLKYRSVLKTFLSQVRPSFFFYFILFFGKISLLTLATWWFACTGGFLCIHLFALRWVCGTPSSFPEPSIFQRLNRKNIKNRADSGDENTGILSRMRTCAVAWMENTHTGNIISGVDTRKNLKMPGFFFFCRYSCFPMLFLVSWISAI